MTDRIAGIFGWRAPTLSADAAAFFRACRPWGFILFAEACVSRDQVRRLIAALHEAVQAPAPVFIDQEGGRVARLKPPEWPKFPPAAAYGALYARDPEAGLEACRLGHRLIAHELYQLGIRADCAPVLDLPIPGADPIIGDRAFGDRPDPIAALGRAALEGLAGGGVAGVIKHLPGHGKAPVDSHLALPRVSASRAALAPDFACFKALNDAPMGMTAHVLYEAIDPARPGTLSPIVVQEIIRGDIGFDGLLMSDDLNMKALGGSWSDKAQALFAAGCDMALHCSGDLAEMEALAVALPRLEGKALARAQIAEAACAKPPSAFDEQSGWSLLSELLARGAAMIA